MPVLTLPGSAKSPRRRASPSREAKQRWLDDPEVGMMLRVRDGDEDAFRQLMDLYSARIFGFFCRRLGDRQEAEDLTQEVLLRLFRSRQRYEPRARFSTWIFHITQNVIRNALRFRQRHPSVYLTAVTDDENLLDVLLSGTSDAPSRPLERAELAGVVRTAIAGLGARQRAALELHQFEDQTYAEVAAQLDMTPKAAKSLLYRTRNLLRVRLTSLLDND
ncbi:MAG TPA: sigma-70 family RNA polymerase sigma factor [Gemmataceae bacterium]|nr:sigma-70 family RNA polymerase sigma factor [Gemmataceae bacterium]